MISQHYSPLRYPGGKGSLYDFLKQTLKKNNIIDGVYAEGFAGGCGAALNLLMLEDVNEIYLNDKDELIYKFWHSVLNDTDELLRFIHDTKPTLDEWNRRKQILRNPAMQKEISSVELGFTAFFLNRCNRSGILKAGVIGGNEQTGNWKIDARYNKQELTERIKKISLYKDRIHLFNNDVITFLRKLKKCGIDDSNLLIYLDPPYVTQGKELYRYYFTNKDHARLATYLLKNMNDKWIVSYDDNPLIHSAYRDASMNIFEFNYYANNTKIGRELIIASRGCMLPESYLHYSKRKKMEGYTFALKQAV
jgi:DNA adenine methylase